MKVLKTPEGYVAGKYFITHNSVFYNPKRILHDEIIDSKEVPALDHIHGMTIHEIISWVQGAFNGR